MSASAAALFAFPRFSMGAAEQAEAGIVGTEPDQFVIVRNRAVILALHSVTVDAIVEDDSEGISRKLSRLDYCCALADLRIWRWVILAFAGV